MHIEAVEARKTVGKGRSSERHTETDLEVEREKRVNSESSTCECKMTGSSRGQLTFCQPHGLKQAVKE